MSKKTDDEILKAAEQINDGKFDDNEFNQSTDHDDEVFAALKKINQITQQIRQQAKTNSHQMKAGDQWAHLEIIKKIGQGGIGEVYCAFDPVLDSKVAVKFLSQKSQLYISQQQFLDEARYMAKVRNPHVLAIHGATTDNDRAGYWSDYLDGTQLNELLEQTTLTQEQQLLYAQHLCQAVKAIHNNQLVHGDIKAMNVMIQPERGAILLDFGSSRKSKSLDTGSYIQQASPMAMAPEQFQGRSASAASDVFALGLVFWQLSSKIHPLADLTLKEIKHQINHLKHMKNRIQGSRLWKHLILSMLEPEPTLRPTIRQIEKSLHHIRNAPTKRAKQLALTSVLVLAAGITGISLYSSYKTTQAQQETHAMNTILSDILMKSSPLNKGKDILLMDVLIEAENTLMVNNEISEQQKIKSLSQLLQTYRFHTNNSQALELATKLLNQFNLSDSERLDLLMQKADIFNRNRDFKSSEPLYLEALKIKPVNKNDTDVLVLAHIGLIKNYIETFRLDEIPSQIFQAKSVWEESNRKQSNLGLIHQIEGNYYERKKQYNKAFEFYQKAIANFEAFYGEKNLNVLIAKGNAATVLTFNEETRSQGAQLQENVVAEMTDFLGAEHGSTLIARANLSSIYAQLKQPIKAIETLVPFMPNVYNTYGKESGRTLAFENIVAELYVAAGDNQRANEIFKRIISVQTNHHGADSKLTLNSRLKRVLFLQQTKQLKEANEMLMEIHNIALEALPENDRVTLDIQEHLIWNQYLQGSSTARQEMKALTDKKIKIYGADDPSTLSATNHLTQMQQ
ncbi:MAG: protein kinase [Marinicella sp.]|nr:protein kinase [Xanthomonadales bacterium]